MSQGAFDIAQFECARCLLDDPANIEVRLIMSSLYYRSGKYQSAVHYALQAQALLSKSNMWHEVLVVSARLAHLGEDHAALDCLNLISIDNEINIPGAYEMAKQFQLLDDYRRALDWLALAEKHHVNMAQTAELRGMIYMFYGDLAGSEKELEKSIVEYKNPSVSPHLLLSMCGNAEARIERLKKLTLDNQFLPHDLPYLYYTLFKELDGFGHTEQAWQALSQASDLRRKEVFYSSDLENMTYEELINATEHLEIGEDRVADVKSSPIFIIGMPRSGTSLLESMLAGDSSVAACGELKVMRSQIQFVLNKTMGNPFDREILKSIPSLDYDQLGRRYLEKAGWRASQKPFFIDKNPSNFNYAGMILKAMPNARIINLVRYPMDVCFSNLKEVFGPQYYTYSYTQEECANHYRNYRRLMTHWHNIAPGKILDVAYENLVSQPAAELKKIQEYCGLENRPYQEKSRNSDFRSNSASTVQLREKIHTRNLNGWQRYQKYLAALEDSLKQDCEDYTAHYLG